MTVLQNAEKVLREAGEPLHANEIAKRMIAKGLWSTTGKTPGATVNARLAVDIKNKGLNSRFQRTSGATFGLLEWGRVSRASTKQMHRNRGPE